MAATRALPRGPTGSARMVFATLVADRADWDAATRAQRHLAVAADAEPAAATPISTTPAPLGRTRPRHRQPAGRAHLTAGQSPGEMGQWITDGCPRCTFAERLADRQSLTIPSEKDPRLGDLGQAFPSWPRPARDAILQPPKPEIRPSQRLHERAADHDIDREAAD